MRILPLLALSVAALCGAEKFGKGLTLNDATPLAALLNTPDDYVGKMVQVKGKVTEVCQMAGCWMALADLETAQVLRVKVHDGDLVFPKESVGKIAIAEGTLTKLSLTKEQATAMAKHEAEEQGRKFNPASVKSGVVIYQLKGAGAVIER